MGSIADTGNNLNSIVLKIKENVVNAYICLENKFILQQNKTNHNF